MHTLLGPDHLVLKTHFYILSVPKAQETVTLEPIFNSEERPNLIEEEISMVPSILHISVLVESQIEWWLMFYETVLNRDKEGLTVLIHTSE